MLVGVDAERRLIISSRETAYKVRNLRRDPWAQLCVFTDKFFGEWVVVEGEAEILSLPEAMEPLVDYFRRLVGEHKDWDEYRDAMRRDQRVLIRIQPHSARAPSARAELFSRPRRGYLVSSFSAWGRA